MKTRPQLTINLNLVDLSQTGFWFCLSGQHVTERDENYHGLGLCKLCGSPRIRWNPPVFVETQLPEDATLHAQRPGLGDTALPVLDQALAT